MTVSIFLIGGGGVGKTTLVDLLINETTTANTCMTDRCVKVHVIREIARSIMNENGINQADLADDDSFWNLQLMIARKQIDQEKQQETNSKACTDDGQPDDEKTKSKESLLLGPLVGEGLVQEVINRYRKSIMVLVNPFDCNGSKDDGVRLVMDKDELEEYTDLCRKILKLLHIPFIDLREQRLSSRVKVLQQVIEQRNLAQSWT